LENLVRQLDDHRYLDSPSIQIYYDSQVQEFRCRRTRPARHAGAAYAESENELRAQIDGFFASACGSEPATESLPPRPLRGLIAPHIDFQRGGPSYALAYKALAEHSGADRFIIFGTCHNPMGRRFALTEKDYETPLGAAAADREFIRRVTQKLPWDPFEDEFAHRGEHSIEFQAVCLRYVLGKDRQFTIVPVLVGSFHDILITGRAAAEDAEIAAMVSAIRETMAELPGRYCVIAGADLAHVGLNFGDAAGPSEASLREVARADREFLKRVEQGAAEEAFRFIAAERDRRRVCGYPPIYMTLRCLENTQGKLLDYRQWADLEARPSASQLSRSSNEISDAALFRNWRRDAFSARKSWQTREVLAKTSCVPSFAEHFTFDMSIGSARKLRYIGRSDLASFGMISHGRVEDSGRG
jgi:hypothetical protein